MFRNASVRLLVFTVALIFSLCGSVDTQAQTFRGTVLGTVKDNTGAVVPGASVSNKNIDTGVARNAETDTVGSFTVPELPIGLYELTVQLSGFQTVVAGNIKVEVASERRVDVTLRPV